MRHSNLAEAIGYYGIFALLSVAVRAQVHISERQIPIFCIIGSAGALAGRIGDDAFFDRLGRRRTVGLFYAAAAGGVGVLSPATATGSAALAWRNRPVRIAGIGSKGQH